MRLAAIPPERRQLDTERSANVAIYQFAAPEPTHGRLVDDHDASNVAAVNAQLVSAADMCKVAIRYRSRQRESHRSL